MKFTKEERNQMEKEQTGKQYNSNILHELHARPKATLDVVDFCIVIMGACGLVWFIQMVTNALN